MSKKTFWQYQRMIWDNSIRKASDWLGLKGRVITIIIALLVIVLSGWTSGKFDVTSVLYTAGFVMLFLAIAAVVLVSKEPIVIYNSQVVEIADLKKQLQPDIKMDLEKFEPSSVAVGIKIRNRGTYSLEKCKVALLEDVHPRVIRTEILPADLHWSTNNPDQEGYVDIPRGQTAVLDIAKARSDFSCGNFELRRRDDPLQFDPGEYSIKLSISGRSSGVDFPAQIFTARIVLDKGQKISIEDIKPYIETSW